MKTFYSFDAERAGIRGGRVNCEMFITGKNVIKIQDVEKSHVIARPSSCRCSVNFMSKDMGVFQ